MGFSDKQLRFLKDKSTYCVCGHRREQHLFNSGHLWGGIGSCSETGAGRCDCKKYKPARRKKMPEDRPIKALYLSDWNGDHADELQMIKEQVKDALGYDLEIEHIQQPPFDKYTSTSQSFDILFFDYGGAGVVGNSMFEHMTHALLQDAEDHPSRVYIVTSSFTWDYMREAREAFADKVHNVFVSSAMAHDDHDQGFEELKKALTMAGLKVVA